MYSSYQNMPPNQMHSMSQMANTKYKTQLCRHYSANGVCALGVKCQFAHGQQELRSIHDPLPQNLPPMPNIQTMKIAGVNPMVTNYKTMLCKHYNPLTGVCKNGPTCTFAHGEQELQSGNPYVQDQFIYQICQTRQNQVMQQQINHQQLIQNELTKQILQIILANMEQIFPNQPTIIAKLKQGQDLASVGNTSGASEMIKQIIHAPERTKEEKQQYQTIYNNAQKHYEQKMKELQQQQQFPQY